MTRIAAMIGAMVFCMTLAAVSFHSQVPAEPLESPEAVAKRATDALRENRLGDFAALMHDDALAQLRTTMLSVAEAADEGGQFELMQSIFFDVDSIDAFREMSGADVLIALLKGIGQLVPTMRDMLHNMQVEVLGHVAEGDDVVHVVYRGTIVVEGVTVRKMDVMSMRMHEDGWRMLLTGDIENMAGMLRRSFPPKSDE